MKNVLRLLAVSALLTTASMAAPFLAISDNAEMFLTGTVGVRADNNIFMAPTATSDTIWDINPGVELVFGKTSTLKGTWTFVDSFTNYLDNSDLNDSLLSSALNAENDDGKTKSSINASFAELNQNSVDTRGGDFLIRRDVLAAGGKVEVSLTDKSSLLIGGQYQNTDYKTSGFSDTTVATFPVKYYYEFTPKVDMSLNYRYRESWLQHGYDSKDNFIGIGARGDFTPKLTGEISVGITQRNFGAHKGLPDQDDETLPGIDASLAYAVSPKTTMHLGVTNDFDTNSQGQQQKNLAIRILATSNISEEWSITGGFSYRAIDYYTRADDYMEAQFGVTYTINEYLNINAALAIRSNESDLNTSDFDNNVFSLAAHIRY